MFGFVLFGEYAFDFQHQGGGIIQADQEVGFGVAIDLHKLVGDGASDTKINTFWQLFLSIISERYAKPAFGTILGE